VTSDSSSQQWWGLEKFRVQPLAQSYERTLYIDADVYRINDLRPNNVRTILDVGSHVGIRLLGLLYCQLTTFLLNHPQRRFSRLAETSVPGSTSERRIHFGRGNSSTSCEHLNKRCFLGITRYEERLPCLMGYDSMTKIRTLTERQKGCFA
jgi:hypothetical protein